MQQSQKMRTEYYVISFAINIAQQIHQFCEIIRSLQERFFDSSDFAMMALKID